MKSSIRHFFHYISCRERPYLLRRPRKSHRPNHLRTQKRHKTARLFHLFNLAFLSIESNTFQQPQPSRQERAPEQRDAQAVSHFRPPPC